VQRADSTGMAGSPCLQEIERLGAADLLGHFSRVLAARWIDLPTIGGQRLVLDTGTLSILQDDPRHPENRVISLWNSRPTS
jgi:hypothetical protein